MSVLIHAAAIAGAVAATGRAATVLREPAPRPLIFVAPPSPPAPRTEWRSGATASRGGPAAPTRAATPADLAEPALPALPSAPVAVAIPTTGDRTALAPADDFRRGGLNASSSGPVRATGGGSGPWSAATVERAAAPRPGNPVPRYPDALRAAGAEGQVVARFVVDTAGRVEPGSLEIVRADDPRFADAVRSAVPLFRFLPAEAGGRRVRQLVEAPFAFTLRR